MISSSCTEVPVSEVPDFGQLCFEKYKSLPKTGKPKSSEWTVLSCIIQQNKKTNVSKIVALGTGTKCIGSDQLCRYGLILNDSHAEIIARRAFLRYIYNQISKHNKSPADDGIFEYDYRTKRFELKEEISFHFFSTYPPCGDASIISNFENENVHNPPPNKKIKTNCSQNNFDNLIDGTSSEIFTGAKLINTIKTDLMDQEIGAVRTKPGRGIRTLSMSCSDKISRWNILGLQGALLDSVLEKPIYLDSFTFCSNCNLKSISRALYKRWIHKPFKNDRFHIHEPKIHSCSLDLPSEFIASNEKEPSPASIVWCDVDERPLEVAVAGKRQGITKRNWYKKSSSLNISKVILFEQFKKLLKCNKSILTHRFVISEKELEYITYKSIKSQCLDYQNAWNYLKKEHIGIWTSKSEDLIEFS